MWEWSESLVRRVDRSAMAHLWQWAAMYRNPVRGRECVYKADLRNPGSRPRVGACRSQCEAEGLHIWQTNPSPWKVISLDLHPPDSTPAAAVSSQVTFKWLPCGALSSSGGGKKCVRACTSVCVFFMCTSVCVYAGVVLVAGRWSGRYSELKQCWKTWASLRSL